MFIKYKHTGKIKEVSDKKGAMRIKRGDAVEAHNAKSVVVPLEEKLLRAKYLVKFEKESDAGWTVKQLKEELGIKDDKKKDEKKDKKKDDKKDEKKDDKKDDKKDVDLD
jgi:hypothetical protein